MKKTGKPNITKEDVGNIYTNDGQVYWKLVEVIPEPQATMHPLSANLDPITDVISKFKDFIRLEPVSALPKPPRKVRSDKGSKKSASKLKSGTGSGTTVIGEQASTPTAAPVLTAEEQAANEAAKVLAREIAKIKEK